MGAVMPGMAVLSPAVLSSCKQRVERTLVEGGNHRLGDVREEVVDAESSRPEMD